MRQARVLAQATSDLVNAMRSDAEAEVDVDNSKKLLAAAKLLADATARMVEAAKVRVFPRLVSQFKLCRMLQYLIIVWDFLITCVLHHR